MARIALYSSLLDSSLTVESRSRNALARRAPPIVAQKFLTNRKNRYLTSLKLDLIRGLCSVGLSIA